MNAYIESTSPDLQCQATTKRGHRCGNIPAGWYNGLALCARHMRESRKVFVEHVHSWDGDQCHYCHIPRALAETGEKP